MLNYVFGDLLDSDETFIVHGCNSQGVMGSGIARTIRELYPDCFTEYRQHFEEHGLSIGDVVFYDTATLTIANAITQASFGQDGVYVDYDGLKKSVIASLFVARWDEAKSVGMPMIGAGLGGGDWKIISAILEEASTFVGVDINVYVIDQKVFTELTAT